MALDFEEQAGGLILFVTASGKLSKADYEHFVPETERRIQQFGKIRILFEMRDFHGWDPSGIWEDVKFDLKHFKDIERLAIVGEKAWEQGMAAFCRLFTTAQIQYFDCSQEEEAMNWIHAGIGTIA